MAKTIPQELSSFKSTVSPSLEPMNTSLTEMNDKINEVIEAIKNANDGVDKYYNSSNKQTIIDSITNLNTSISSFEFAPTIMASVSVTLLLI